MKIHLNKKKVLNPREVAIRRHGFAAPPPATSLEPPARSKDFPPGWNGAPQPSPSRLNPAVSCARSFSGLAKTPPLGWRSWNAFGNRITQDMMMEAAEALVARNRTIAGHPGKVSLCDVGYCSVGVDEGWEACGAGVNGTQHAVDGTPTVDKAFPDTKGMVDQIHALGLSAGWYLNGCKCGERHALDKNYEGDVRSLAAFGFDGVKIDGCGAQRNQTFYAALMRGTGRAYTIENCHWGRCTQGDDSSCPTRDWCPLPCYAHDYTRCELGLQPLTCTALVQVPVQLVPHLGRHQRGRGELVPKPADDDQVPGLRGAAQPARLLGAYQLVEDAVSGLSDGSAPSARLVAPKGSGRSYAPGSAA